MLAGGTVQAQTGLGVLVGSVVDAESHRELRDVTVTASSPSLQSEQSVSTDDSGNYRLSQLPVGTYALRFESPAHRPYVRRGIELLAGQTLRLNVELLPETGTAEEIVVRGSSPLIDVGSTQTGLVVPAQFAEHVPLQLSTQGAVRDVTGLALVAPQTQQDLYGIAISGAGSPENQVLLDGLSINDTGYGVSGTRFSVEFAQQLDVITGGYLPEYGRSTGGVLAVVSRSGGNEFHGSVFMTFTPGFLAQSGRAVVANNSIFGSRTSLHNSGDFGFTLGGYIVQDKLWFFVGFNPSFERNSLERTVSVFDVGSNGETIPTAGGFQRTDVPAATRRYFQDTSTYPFFGKLTYLVSPDHRFSVQASGVPSVAHVPFARGVNGTFDTLGLHRPHASYDVVGQLNSSFARKTVLLDLVVGWHHQQDDDLPIDGSWIGSGVGSVSNVVWGTRQTVANFADREPAYVPELATICSQPDGAARCAVTRYATGGPDFVTRLGEDRIQAKAILTGLVEWLGHHVLKVGLDIDFSRFDRSPGIAGGASYQADGIPDGATFTSLQGGYLGGADAPVFFPTGPIEAATSSLTLGGFVQDSWSVLDRFTLNLGVRYDTQTVYGGDGKVALVLGDQWSPRIGVIWDPTQQGRAKLFASYAWYYEQNPLRMADFGFSGRSLVQAVFFGCRDPSLPSNGRCDSQPGTSLLPGGAGPNKNWTAYSLDELVDPATAAQRADEVVVGGEYELLPRTRLALSYTHRSLARVVEDFSLNGSTFSLGNPGQGIGAALEEPVRNYDAVSVSLARVFDGRWLARASYTYSVLTGNFPGLFNVERSSSEVTDLGPNVSESYDYPPLRVNRSGPLPSDFRHQIKIHAAYRLQVSASLGLSLGAVYNGRSGAPISVLSGFDGYGANSLFILPRGIAGRLPWVHQLDLHATFDVSFGRATVLSLGADCFNVLGSQQVVSVDQSYVFPRFLEVVPIPNGKMADLPGKARFPDGTPLPPDNVNTNFGHATQYQTPRTVRLLARVSF